MKVRVNGIYCPPADKSITHRALLLSAMADGRSKIHNPLICTDCVSTINVLKKLGVKIIQKDNLIEIASSGYPSFTVSDNTILQCDNSGTTARLIAGMLAPNRLNITIDGDKSLRNRPMERILKLLSAMNANIYSEHNNSHLPIKINPTNMHPAKYSSTAGSAQIKSAFLLAALQIEGESIYQEALQSRDHTERMMPVYGIQVNKVDDRLHITGRVSLTPAELTIPGDISSTAFMIAAVLIFEKSTLTVKHVGLNPTRIEFIKILQSWGAEISTTITHDNSEPIGVIEIKYSELSGGVINGNSAQYAIDELPLLAMLGIFTRNPVTIKNAKELRYKESDRIEAVASNLKALGAMVEVYDDGLTVYPLQFKNISKELLLNSYNDHRIAMINVLLAKRFGLNIIDDKCIAVSYPNFIADLDAIFELSY